MTSSPKLFTFEDVAKHNKKGDCWVIVYGKVYDVTSFMDDHPGGDEVLVEATAKDATEDFIDVGHSDDAKDYMDNYYIGEIDSSTLPATQHYSHSAAASFSGNEKSGGLIKILQFLIPLLILGIAFALRQSDKKE